MTLAFPRSRTSKPRVSVAVALFLVATAAGAQTAASTSTPPSAPAARDALAALAWLAGCWKGAVTQREFTEQWSAAAGDAMRGTSRMIIGGVSQGDDTLRLEARPDGLYYVIAPAAGKETSLRFAGRTTETVEGRSDEIFTFENPAQPFPQRITYRHTAGGALYAEVAGKVNGADRTVIYPMHKVECARP